MILKNVYDKFPSCYEIHFWQEYEWWLEKLEIAHNVWAILRTNRQYGVSPIEIP